MENRIEFVYGCTEAMFNYTKDGNVQKLVNRLREIESHSGGELWFRFGKDDTLATTIDDINVDLCLPKYHPNYELMVEKFEGVCGIEPDKELRVFVD
jgi:hypothetical protein